METTALYLVSTSVYILADQISLVNSNFCVWLTHLGMLFSAWNNKQQGLKHGHHVLRISYTLRMSNNVQFWGVLDRSILHSSRTNRVLSISKITTIIQSSLAVASQRCWTKSEGPLYICFYCDTCPFHRSWTVLHTLGIRKTLMFLSLTTCNRWV